ncbi:MAG TPA: RNA polymerase sigma factor, partial [Gemmataceae bacterium]|nr:RNA polymerase sigma factor [Gemmataceae bacterium]
GVAHNVARKARTNRHRRTVKEEEAAAQPRPEPLPPNDVAEFLDAELAALPDKYRAAVVLCDLRGLTMQQAADEVGCPAKTLGSRLQRGRALLAHRLARKGVLPAVAALPAIASAAPPALIDATARAVGSKAAVTPAVAALVTGGSAVMFKTTLKFVLLAGVLGVAAGPVWHSLHAAPGSTERSASPGTKPPAPNQFLAALRVLHEFVYHHFQHVTHVLDDKKEEKKVELSGTWTKNEGELKITFEKDTLKISPHGKDDILLIVCEYTADKKGPVKGKVTGLEGNEMALKVAREKLPVGTEFSFTWKVTKETAKLDEVKCEKADILKAHMEGDFTEKK